jgi:hypothetical protein
MGISLRIEEPAVMPTNAAMTVMRKRYERKYSCIPTPCPLAKLIAAAWKVSFPNLTKAMQFITENTTNGKSNLFP